MDQGVAGNTAIKVFLLDDHEIVRRGVKELLEAEPDISVIGEAGHRRVSAGADPCPEAGRRDSRCASAGRRWRQRVPRYPVADA